MKKVTVIARFSSKVSANNAVRNGVLWTLIISFLTVVTIFFMMQSAPVGAETQASGFAVAVAGFGVYGLHNRLHAISTQNEKRRLAFSQQLRAAVRKEITGVLSLEGASAIMRGGVTKIQGYNLWIERAKGEALLMTDKPMGVKQYQMYQ